MIDASECVPTYNSGLLYLLYHYLSMCIESFSVAYNDIRGFMGNDYFKKSLNSETQDTFVS